MIKVVRVDPTGLYLEDILLAEGALVPSDCIAIAVTQGLLQPKWDAILKVWAEGATQANQLLSAKNDKTNEIESSYQQALSYGFASSCTGVALIYDYTEESQRIWVELFASLMSNFIPDAIFPMPITIKSGTVVLHTKLQLQQLGSDLTVWKFQLHGKYQAITNAGGTIAIATTLSAVSAITW